MTSFISTNVVKQQSLKESSFVTSERAQIKSKTYEMRLAYLTSRLFSRSLTLRLVFPCVFLFSRLWTYSSTKESSLTKHFSQCVYNKARDALGNRTDSLADVSSNSFSALTSYQLMSSLKHVRGETGTHAYIRGLRPEHNTLDRSATLTCSCKDNMKIHENLVYQRS